MNEEYQELYEKAKGLIAIKEDLPDAFCRFVLSVQGIKPETFSDSVKQEVRSLFYDVNTEIQKYNEQYQILINELGVMCGIEAKDTVVHRFFKAYLDLLGLAYNIYKEYPEKLKIFLSLLQDLVVLLETNTIQLKEDPLQKALLTELVKSSWILTQNDKDLLKYTKTLRGGNQRRTRKARRTNV